MHENLPRFTASSYTTNTSNLGQLIGSGSILGGSITLGGTADRRITVGDGWSENAIAHYKQAYQHFNQPQEAQMSKPVVDVTSKLRIVRVFLVDPDNRVPVGKRVLYRSDELTTDATDQELYFDIPVNDLLKAHNAERADVEWEEKTSEGTKTRKGLKEVRIRDLVMSVTTIAQF